MGIPAGRACAWSVLLLAACASSSLEPAVGSSGEYWRGTKRAKQCKICRYIAGQMFKHPGKEGWPDTTEGYVKLLGGWCADGKPKKGKAVITYFDTPPSHRTWLEIGQYCTQMAQQKFHEVIVKMWKQNNDNDQAAAAVSLSQFTNRMCGTAPPPADEAQPAWDPEWEPRGAEVCEFDESFFATDGGSLQTAGGKIHHRRVHDVDSTTKRDSYFKNGRLGASRDTGPVPLTFTGDMADPFAGDPPLESDAESDVESYAESDVESDGSEPEDYGADASEEEESEKAQAADAKEEESRKGQQARMVLSKMTKFYTDHEPSKLTGLSATLAVLLPAYTGREEELLRDLQAQHSKRAAAAQATATAGTDQEALFDPFARSNAGWQVEPGESDGDHKPEL